MRDKDMPTFAIEQFWMFNGEGQFLDVQLADDETVSDDLLQLISPLARHVQFRHLNPRSIWSR